MGWVRLATAADGRGEASTRICRALIPCASPESMFTVGHLSDLHATPVEIERPGDLMNKRALGWLSWKLRRRHVYRPDVLAALLADLAEQAPDQVVVTGDLTNVALESEFAAARAWLERIGGPERVFAIPGNHDAYVRVPRERSWDLWDPFIASDDAEGQPVAFPTLRVRGPAALVGLCSALPTAPFFASGRLGEAQLERLEKLLAGLADSPLCRIVLVHHPPTAGAVSRRRALSDAAALRAVLGRTGADLVLHGHAHRLLIDEVAGPRGRIPVVGVRSSSYGGDTPDKRAQYHLYRIEAADAPGAEGWPRFRVTLRVRGYDPAAGRFGGEEERAL